MTEPAPPAARPIAVGDRVEALILGRWTRCLVFERARRPGRWWLETTDVPAHLYPVDETRIRPVEDTP